jgi:predicted nucleic acid-binding protein
VDQIDLIGLDPSIRILAQTAKPVTVRSPDAIHLGTALHARQALTSFVTYDKRLLDAALAAGLPADAPA